jgi:carbonic anhydrase/acetyltransferase-like protein (isoleucine patch superfamily)
MGYREYGFEGREPEVHDSAYVSRESTLIGDVTVESNASIWAGAVLRGDIGPVHVGAQSHIGDNAMLHASTVGDRSMVSAGVVLNNATVGDTVLVGFNATVTDVTIDNESIIAAGAVVLQSTDVPGGSFVYGVPARTTPLSETNLNVEEMFEEYSSGKYADLAARHEALFE